jgi:hypothetical protein
MLPLDVGAALEDRRSRGWSAGVIASVDILRPIPDPPELEVDVDVDIESPFGGKVYPFEPVAVKPVSFSCGPPGEDPMGEDEPVIPLPTVRSARR